jgi:hypothetical protein
MSRKAKKPNQGGGASGIPARQVGRQPFSHTGFNTLHHVPVDYEATQESRFVTWARFQPNFVEIISQPYEIVYVRPDGSQGVWYPDYRVRWKAEKPWIVELKQERLMQTRDDRRLIAAKIRGGRTFARTKGMWMRMLTEKTTASQSAANAVFLTPFRKWSPAPHVQNELIAAAASQNTQTLRDVVDSVVSRGCLREDAIAALWHLVATFRILIDYDAPILMSSRVRGTTR